MIVKVNNKIISIVVVSYNSESTIRETLASILNQTFDISRIEVVFADDNSSDDTQLIIKNWAEKYNNEFYAIKFAFSEVNSGVAINCNNGWRIATGDWIKSIAADDILHVECIHKNFEYVKNTNISVLFSKMQVFTELGISERVLPNKFEIEILNSNIKKQLSFLYINSLSGAPTVFMKKNVLCAINFADERYPMIEDYPLWLRFLKHDIQLFFMDDITVYYRVDESISRSKEKFVNKKYFDDLFLFEKENIFPSLQAHAFTLYRKKIWYFLMFKLIKLTNNQRGFFSSLVYKILLILKPGVLSQVLWKMR